MYSIPTSDHCIVTVTDTKEGCEIPVGHTRALDKPEFIIGRGNNADIQLNDPTISGKHVLIKHEPGSVAVKNLSERGTTYVNGRKLAHAAACKVTKSRLYLQLGAVLLKVRFEPKTLPSPEVIPVPEGELFTNPATLESLEPSSHFLVIRGRKQIEVWLAGQYLHLYPAASRVLLELCSAAGEFVDHDKLAYAMDPEYDKRVGGTTLSQVINQIRRALDKAIKEGQVDFDEFQKRVAAVDPSVKEVEDPRSLLRKLLSNKRGVGYRISLPPESIQVVR